MKLFYTSIKLEEQCTNIKEANKIFDGDKGLAVSLMARINALKQAETIKDIIVQPSFRFHKLKNKNGKDLEGFFAIDVKTKKQPWRIIVQPLKEDQKEYDPCNIDEIANVVKIVKIKEVSKHYE